MADEAQNQTNTSGRPPGARVSLMPWNNTSTSATRFVFVIGLLIAIPFLAALIYGMASKKHPATPATSTAQPK